MFRWFADLKVTHKLALGFGMLLVLTLVQAGIGWQGLSSLSSRADKVRLISELNASLGALQVARLQYIDASGATDQQANLQQRYDAFFGQLDSLRGSFRLAENNARIERQYQVMQSYGDTLREIFATYTAAKSAQQQMGSLAKEYLQLIEGIRNQVRSMPDAEQRFARIEAINQIYDNLFMMRYQVRGYTGNVNADTEKVMMAQLSKTRNELPGLASRFAGDFSQEFQRLSSLNGEYAKAVEDFRAQSSKLADSRQTTAQDMRTVDDLNAAMLASQLTASAQDSEIAKSLQLAAALAALLLGSLAAVVISRQITTPLAQTLEALERVAAGDLSEKQQHAQRKDELGALQNAVQRMSRNLRELIGGVRDSVTQIASSAEELSAVTEQTSAGANAQKDETDQVATAMQEMAATVHEVARNAGDASSAASSTDEEARQGEQVVARAIAQIDLLAQQVGNTSQAMEVLRGEGDRIGSVMDVIKAVAEQTNLLALNAAIEAARAGEAGRGFAVVADEVHSLAQRTQKSTEEIEQAISSLNQGTRNASEMMDESRKLTDSSVSLVREAGAALGMITAQISNIQSMNQQIAAASEEQSAVAEEISRSVVNVRDISEQTASASQQTSASSIELARLGSHLQEMIGRFRV